MNIDSLSLDQNERQLLTSASFWLYLFCLVSQLNQKIEKRTQTTKNKFKSFCLHLGKMADISKNFKTKILKLSWLPVTERFNHCISSTVIKHFNDQCSNNWNEVFKTVDLQEIIFKQRKFSSIKTTPPQN